MVKKLPTLADVQVPKVTLQDLLDKARSGSNTKSNTPSGAGINQDLDPNDLYGSMHSNDWRNVLGSLGSGDDFSSLLAELGIGNIDMKSAQMGDWNSELLKQILQHYITTEQRQYDRFLQQDQRLYDSPTNQLARLMGAGISRDAALQLLGGSGSGSGAAVPYGVTGAESTLTPESQSYNNEMQAKAAMVNAVFGSIHNMAGAIGALGSFGLSAASLQTNLAATRAATAGQVLSNTQLRKTLNGIETASTVVGAISSAYQAGIIDKDHTFSSSQEMLKYIRDNADKYEPFGSLVSTGMLDGIGKDVYSLDALNHAYESWRKTKDYNIDRRHIVNMQALDELFKNIDIQKMQAEISMYNQQIQESIANVINSTKLTNAQVVLFNSQAAEADAKTDILKQEYDINQFDLDWLTANIDDINNVRTNQLMLDAARWNALRDDPKAWNAEIESWLSDKANLRTAIAIESYYYSGRLDAIKNKENNNIPFNDVWFSQMATWFHNLFAQASLPRPGSATQHERDVLGNLSGSGVALWALRKASRLP